MWRGSDAAEGSLPPFADGSLLYAAGDRIVFASEQNEGGRNHLYSVAAAGGPPLLLTPGDYDVEDVALGAGGASILFSANEHRADPADEDRRHLWRVAVAGGAPRPLTWGQGIEWSPVETGDGKAVLCLGSTATTPAVPCRVAAGAGANPAAAAAAGAGPAAGNGREPLARDLVPAEFPAAQLVVPRQVIWKSGDGTTLHGQLFLPRAAPRDGHSLPALVFTHGGPVRQMLLGDLGCGEEGCEDVQISPDGRSALWAARHKLWLAPVAGGAAPRALHDLQGDSSQARWSPDGQRVAFRLDRRDPAACSPPSAWRATPISSPPGSISTACTTGRCCCRAGRARRRWRPPTPARR